MWMLLFTIPFVSPFSLPLNTLPPLPVYIYIENVNPDRQEDRYIPFPPKNNIYFHFISYHNKGRSRPTFSNRSPNNHISKQEFLVVYDLLFDPL